MPVNLTTFTSPHPFKTAVLFLIFNRLDTTKEVFEAIRQARPPRIYIAADGARISRVGEDVAVQKVRDYVVNHIDWECEVKTLFRDKNLGCKCAISGAITWFFENEEMGIVLEDDCLPHPTFFRYCEELLERYRDDERIGMISGDNFQFGKMRTESSYYFSKYTHIWGWASWRRAWKNYNVKASVWPEIRDGDWLKNIVHNSTEQVYWSNIFQSVHDGKINTWDYQWTLALWAQGMISVMPCRNLISNIGFGSDATHTHGESIYSKIPVNKMIFPIQHPTIFLPCLDADIYTGNRMFSTSRTRKFLTTISSFFY